MARTTRIVSGPEVKVKLSLIINVGTQNPFDRGGERGTDNGGPGSVDNVGGSDTIY